MLASTELADAPATAQPPRMTLGASDSANVQDELAAGLDETLQEDAELHEGRVEDGQSSDEPTATHDPAEL